MNRRRRQSAASAHERLQPWQLTAQVAAIVVGVGLVYLPAFLRDRRKAFARQSYRVRRFPGFLPAGAALKDAGRVFACGVVALRMVARRECNKRELPP